MQIQRRKPRSKPLLVKLILHKQQLLSLGFRWLEVKDAAAKEWIAQKESSGSYTAQNGQYYGRYQLTHHYFER